MRLGRLAVVLALRAMQPAAAAEIVLEAPGPQGPLSGTYIPAGADAPVVLVIPGSGPTDRDGNGPLGLAASPYRMLAEALSRRGIASLRIDKRGMFGSAAAVADANAVTVGDYVHDVRNWLPVLRRHTGQRCVWLVGHSEGGLVALAAAREADGLCGLVLLAAPGRRMGDVLRAQLSANPANAPYLSTMVEAIDRLEKNEPVDVDALPPPARPLFAAPVQGFLRSLFAADPAALAAGTALPLLVVQGGEDLQVAPQDAGRLAAARPDVRRLDLPMMNHVLKDVPPGDVAANLASYGDPAKPLAEGLADGIADFVFRR